VTFSVNLSGVNGGAVLSAPTNTTVTVLSDNAGIDFAAATNTAPETSGFIGVTVLRVNNTNGVASIHYATVNGTGSNAALAGINYSNTSGTLFFNNGESLKSISIPLIHNTNVTGDLNFTVSLSAPTNAQVIAPSNTVVVVQDAEAGLSFTNPTMTVLKSAGSATITVVCSNPRVEPVLLSTNVVPLEVSYATTNGTALAGSDYQAVSGTLVFTNGLATNTFTVPIYNNSLVTGDRTFTVSLFNPTAPGQVTPYGTLTVDISESNSGLRFSQGNYQVYKNGVSATINVYRTGFTNSVATVDYLATNGTAIGGVNFVPTAGTLVFTNGVTSQSFNVALIANTQVQPNLSVLLQLSNPTNGVLVSPSTASLTILENGGSYVIPAGSQMVTNYTSVYNGLNGIIGSNDTVQVLFAFRDSAGLNVSNLIATLLATNGVTPGVNSTMTYGPLTVYGHSVSQPFIFTAHGTNSFSINPTFALYDNAKFIGTAVFNYSLGTWTATFTNPAPIVINDLTNASPYPAAINVSGIGNTLIKATLTLTNWTHTSPQDIDVLVVDPAQRDTLIMSGAGGQNVARHLTDTFDDAATNSLPNSQTGSPAITNGVYQPTSYGVPNPFP